MFTAVQEQKQKGLHCAVMVGNPVRTRNTNKGLLRLFSDGQIVLYGFAQKTQPKRIQGFLFRVGEGDSSIPGVYPKVNILAHAERRGQVTRLRRSIAWLIKNGYEIDTLNNRFFAKLNSLLAARDFRVLHLKQVIKDANI